MDKAKPKKKAGPKSKKSRPAWAKTEKTQEEEKEAEIDALLEFAYDLDYDQYMEDFDVRQAFEVIRERVTEIRQDQDWKAKLADEWNKTLEEEGEGAKENKPAADTKSQRSVYSYKSNASAASRASMKSRVAAEKKAAAAKKEEWDRSTVASKQKGTVEDRVASQIAADILKDNSKLNGVHSKQSMKKILEREAKKQLLAETGGEYKPPTMSKIIERGDLDKNDPSNLPHLHKCPYV